MPRRHKNTKERRYIPGTKRGKPKKVRVTQQLNCPEALYGNHLVERNGNCRWCGRRVDAPYNPPAREKYQGHTQLGDSYRYHYDPDWGSRKDDI